MQSRTTEPKRLMILGASHLQLPAIKKAKQMGLYVAVADYDSKAVGIPYADEYYNVSTIDEEGVYQAAKSFAADGIMTLATDMPMRAVAFACEKLGLPGISYDTAIKATSKEEMIKTFESHSVEHPWYFILDEHDSMEKTWGIVSYPCICKPTDSSGSRGVILVNSVSELAEAVKYSRQYGRTGRVIIEEFLKGNEVSVEIIVFKGEIFVLAVTDKLTTGAPHFVEQGHSQPSQLSHDDILLIKDLALRAVQSIGIKNGAAHVEIMLTEKGPKMIELGARLGGDCITTHLVPLSTGIDMVKAAINVAFGEAPDVVPTIQQHSAIRYFQKEGSIDRIIKERLSDFHLHACIKELWVNDSISLSEREIQSSEDRSAYVIVQCNSHSEALESCEKVISCLTAGPMD